MEKSDKIKKYYALDEIELENMYNKIQNIVFSKGKQKLERPIAVLTGGQPGAGKSSLVIDSKKQIKLLGVEPIILDGDMYRGFYPKAMEIAKKYPDLYSEITDKAVGKIIGRLINDTILNGYTFIREGTLNSAEIVDQLLESNENYNIVIKLLAVSKEESLLSCFERYISMKKAMGIGRLTTVNAHNKRYIQFPRTARIQANKGINIEVYERGNDIESPIKIYDSTSQDEKYSCFEEALVAGRKNSYLKCRKNAKQRLDRINKEINSLDKDNEGILQELEALNREMSIILHESEIVK